MCGLVLGDWNPGLVMLGALVRQKEPVQQGDDLVLIPRHQLELEDEHLSRTSRLAEEERKSKGDWGGPCCSVPMRVFSFLSWASLF